MAADLHIHVLPDDIEEGVLAVMFSNCFGSKHFGPMRVSEGARTEAIMRVSDMPGVWIGEVSWLKAALFEDSETFVPGPVQVVQDAIGEHLPRLDPALEQKILEALQVPNTTGYNISEVQPVADFLAKHRNKRLFTVSW